MLVSLAVGGAMLMPSPRRADAATPSVADIHALLAERSPGARAAGALYQTKLALEGTGPTERVLDQIRDRPGAAPADVGIPGAAPGATDVLPGGIAPAGSGDGVPAEEGVAGAPSFGDTGFFGLPGTAASGGPVASGSSGQPTTSTTPPTGVTVVPEPATWVSMLFGFAAAGFMLRHRRGDAAPGF